MSEKLYGSEFHASRDRDTRYAAMRILNILYEKFPNLNRVIDVGCGVGTFLNVAKELGALYIKGIDGVWVNPDQLVIEANSFEAIDLSAPLPPLLNAKKYDLAICLEVAEHLPQDKASSFVHWLTSLAPVILFSAAIPGQGGIGHKNEAWLSYWVNIFKQEGFEPLDIIRSQIWYDPAIYFWYRQNTIVFIAATDCKFPQENLSILDIVHPDLYNSKLSARKFKSLSFANLVRVLNFPLSFLQSLIR